jgi:hypothetical protein
MAVKTLKSCKKHDLSRQARHITKLERKYSKCDVENKD